MQKNIISIIFLIAVIFISSEIKAQTTKIDSLANLLSQHKKNDTIRINLLNEIAYKFYTVNVDKTLMYAEEAKELSDKINFIKGKAESLRLIGIYYYMKVDYSMAIKYYQKSISHFEEINNKRGISKADNNIGIIFMLQNDFPKALEYFDKSLKTLEVLGDKRGCSMVYNNKGRIYFYLTDYNKAMEFFQKAQKAMEESGDRNGLSISYNNIGIIYKSQGNYPKAIEYYQKALKINEEFNNKSKIPISYSNIGTIFRLQKNYLKALKYYQKSLELYETNNNKIGIASSLINIGVICKLQGDYLTALNYYQKSLTIREELGDRGGISSCFYRIGVIYSLQDNYSEALKYFQKSLKISVELSDRYNDIESYKALASLYLKQNKTTEAYNYSKKAYILAEEVGEANLLKESSSILAKSCEALGLYKEACKYYVVHNTMSDSLNNEEITRKIAGLEYQYKLEKEKQTIELEQQKKDAISEKELQLQKATKKAFIIVSILVTFIAIFVFYSFLQKRKANRILASQKRRIQIKNERISIQNETLNNNNNILTNTLNKLEETRKQLVQSEKMASIGVLTAGIAHEINNPINFIQAGVNSLERDFKDIELIINEASKIEVETDNLKEKIIHIKELKKEYDFDEAVLSINEILKDVRLGTERTADIVKSLGAFARSDNNILRLLDIHESIETSLVLLRNKYKENIEIIKYFDNNIPEINCNPNKTNQIFMNLLSNAMDAISGKGKICITTKLLADKISISIKDTGPGISKELQSKIFDPFYTNKPEGKGMGLGLYIVYGFIKDHNGSIDIISEPEKGSEFIINLPIT